MLEVDAFGNHDVLAVAGTATFDPATLIEIRVDSGTPTAQTQGALSSLIQPVAVVPDVAIPPTIRTVQIDIKPGAFPNVVNLTSTGAIPVALISTAALDALTIDPATISLDGASVKLVGKGERPLCSADDVNDDGRADLLCHVVTRELPVQGDGVAILDAMTFPTPSSPPIPVRGADFIQIVP